MGKPMTTATMTAGRPPGAMRTWLSILRELYDRAITWLCLVLASILIALS